MTFFPTLSPKTPDMSKIILTVLGLMSFLFTLSSQNTPSLIRNADLNPDGSQLAFSFQGDIWTMDLPNGVAKRLTVHDAYEADPQWSPDGRKILFRSNRYGNYDLFVMTADGSQLQRITHHSATDYNARWDDNSYVIFNTRRLFSQVDWSPEFFRVSIEGGTPTRFLDVLGNAPAVSNNGRFVAYEKGYCRVTREAYRGSAQRDIWIYDRRKNTYASITTYDGQDIVPKWGGGRLYYLSAFSGHYNIYQQPLDGGRVSAEPQMITTYKDMGIRNFDVSDDGRWMVYEKGRKVYLMQSEHPEAAKELVIKLSADYHFDPEETKQFSNNIDDYALSPNGEFLVYSIHGELIITPSDKDKKRTKTLTQSAARDIKPAWLNDSTILFISDQNGNKDLFLMTKKKGQKDNLYRGFETITRVVRASKNEEELFLLSPDRKKIAIREGRGKLVVADIDSTGSLSNEKILLDGWSTPNGIRWSPDGKWLAYSLDDLDFNEEIFIHDAENKIAPVNISMHPRTDTHPVWSQDGSKLGFLSKRNNDDYDVWFVWLKKEDWQKTKRDWEDDEEEEKNSKKDSTEDKSIQIDFDHIYDRLVQVTSMVGDEDDLAISKDGETFYFSAEAPGDETPFLSMKWDGTDSKTILSDQLLYRLNWDNKHKKMYFLARGGTMNLLDLSSKKSKGIPFSAKVLINHPKEREQVFEDAWRALRDGFYDPEFHQNDWNALKATYKPIAMAASTTQDFRMVYNEMLGQLNASHMGLFGKDPEKTQSQSTGLLGTELMQVKKGLEVVSVIPDSPADRTRSKLSKGDVIIAIDNQEITRNTNIYQLLRGKANERTLVDFIDKKGKKQQIVIRPAMSLRKELYEAWVKEKKRLTEKYSNGKLGYIHIQGMNWSSFERFQRELTASGYGKEGLIIDVRFNGGGWTTDMLMAVLTNRQHAYTIPRGATNSLKNHEQFINHYPFGERLPFPPMRLPSIAMCNEASYSNAEIFSHAYKGLGLGTLVGQPTFGAVISTGGYRLMDGSFVRMPFRAWYAKATNKNMEHNPAIPDVLIKNAPDARAKGEDQQLKKAVELLLKK